DYGAGDFLAALMMAGAPRRPAVAATLLTELLRADTDPWTTLAWPLLDLGEEREASPGVAVQMRAERSASCVLATDESGLLKSRTLRCLRERYDQLATYEQEYGSKLTTLRRLVLFGVFAIHVHMIRRCHDVLGGPLPPLLLDLFNGQRRSLREASAATLQGGFRAIEQLVVHRIRAYLTEVCGSEVDPFLASLPDDDVTSAIRKEYEAHLADSKPIDALAEAYWKVGYNG